MTNLVSLLSPIGVELDQLLLDPNNPRFAELGGPVETVKEERFAEPKVQESAFNTMREDKFDITELRDTIKTLGFLPMDKIVLREWKGNPKDAEAREKKYVVVEGNRRVTALKSLVELHQSGKETFEPEQIKNFTKIEGLLLDDENAPEMARWVIPGLRHVSGIKEWGPYQKGRTVFMLRESGNTPQVAAQSLGLSVYAANRLWRSYLGLEQMRADEEYGDFAQPRLYSFFEEVFRRPVVKDWLKWEDSSRSFTNETGLKEFYSWIIGDTEQEEDKREPKLGEAKSIRDLGTIINDPAAMSVFRSELGSLPRALARFDSEHPEDWTPQVKSTQSLLASLTPDALRNLEPVEVALLEALRDRTNQVLNDSKLLQGRS